MHGERDVLEHTATGQLLDFENDAPDGGDGLGKELGQLAPDHQLDHLTRRGPGNRRLGNSRPVAHHGVAITQRKDFVEPVTDEHHRRTPIAESAGNAHQSLGLRRRESRCRLIHDDDLCVDGECLGDLDDLLIGDRQPSGATVGPQMHAEEIEQFACPGIHRRPIDLAPRAWLATDEHILCHGEVWKETRLLIDHGHALLSGATRRALLEGVAVQRDLTLVESMNTGQRLEERRLAGTVLAEQRMDLPGRSTSDAPFSANAPPNRLTAPRISNTASVIVNPNREHHGHDRIGPRDVSSVDTFQDHPLEKGQLTRRSQWHSSSHAPQPACAPSARSAQMAS